MLHWILICYFAQLHGGLFVWQKEPNAGVPRLRQRKLFYALFLGCFPLKIYAHRKDYAGTVHVVSHPPLFKRTLRFGFVGVVLDPYEVISG